MKIENKTRYPLAKLRAIVAAVMSDEARKRGPLTSRKYFRVIFGYSSRYTGRASLGTKTSHASWMILRVPRNKLDVASLCALARHELWHSYGIEHRDYSESVLYCVPGNTDKLIAAKLGESLCEPPKTEKPKPSADEIRKKKLALIDAAISRWESKARRADNALRKLRAKQRRLSRPVAGSANEVGPR